MRRAREGRGDNLFTGLVCGIPLLFTGIVATGVSLLDPPPDHVERLSAGCVAIIGLVFGVGFIAITLPPRWGIAGWLWRWCGWVVPVSLVPFVAVLLRYPAAAGERSSRIDTSAGAIVVALGILLFAGTLAWLWLRTVRPGRR